MPSDLDDINSDSTSNSHHDLSKTNNQSDPHSTSQSHPDHNANPNSHTANNSRFRPPNHSGLIILFILSLIVSAGIFSILYISKNTQIPQLPPSSDSITATPTAQQVILPTPLTPPPTISTSTPISQWRQVTRTNWTFQIPQHWHFLECDQDNIVVGSEIPIDQTIECNFDSSGGLISISKRASDFQIPTANIYDSKTNKLLFKVNSSKPILVSNHTAIRQEEENSRGGEYFYPLTRVYLQNNQSTYVITLLDQNNSTTFDQFLTTFKVNNTTPPSNSSQAISETFTTYTNQGYHFSFDYPDNFRIAELNDELGLSQYWPGFQQQFNVNVPDTDIIHLQINVITSSSDPTTWWNEVGQPGFVSMLTELQTSPQNFNLPVYQPSHTTLSGVSAIKVRITNPNSTLSLPSEFFVTIVQHQGNIIMLKQDYVSGEWFTLSNQILNSFQLTN